MSPRTSPFKENGYCSGADAGWLVCAAQKGNFSGKKRGWGAVSFEMEACYFRTGVTLTFENEIKQGFTAYFSQLNRIQRD